METMQGLSIPRFSKPPRKVQTEKSWEFLNQQPRPRLHRLQQSHKRFYFLAIFHQGQSNPHCFSHQSLAQGRVWSLPHHLGDQVGFRQDRNILQLCRPPNQILRKVPRHLKHGIQAFDRPSDRFFHTHRVSTIRIVQVAPCHKLSILLY
jgi:hypothetical protein